MTEAEDRLRAALADQANSWEPPVESSLQRVHTRERRRKLSWMVAAVLALIVCVAGVATAVRATRSGQVAVPAARASQGVSPSETVQPLQGTFTAQVSTPARLAGGWSLTLQADGRLLVSPPASYGGVVSGELYSATREEFRTTLFQTDVCSGTGVGVYTWARTPSGISFTAKDDDCAARQASFSENSWLSTR